MKKFLLVAFLLMPLVLMGCKKSVKTCWSDDWKLCYSKNVRLQKDENNNPFFIMAGAAEPHYLLRKQTDISNAKEIIVRYRVDYVEGTPFLKATDCNRPYPGEISVFFQRAGDDMYAKGDMQYYRWWSRNRPQIREGIHEMVVPLDPSLDLWGSVYSGGSKEFENFFNLARKNVRQIGVTFGGCQGAGHGINVENGTVKFTILNMEVR